MRCTNKIAIEKYGKKAKTRIVPFRPEWDVHPSDNRVFVPYPETGLIFEPCTGNLKIHIEAIDEPYHGGCSAELRVAFICDKCGDFRYTGKGLADNMNLNDWVNALMAQVTEMPFRDTQTVQDDFRVVERALTEKVLAEGKIKRPQDASFEASKRLLDFKRKRYGKDPNWNNMTIEIAKEAGLL